MCRCKICDGLELEGAWDGLEDLHKRFKRSVGDFIGCGIDGSVFKYGKTRALKIVNTEYTGNEYGFVSRMFKSIKEKRPEGVVRLYEYGRLGDWGYYTIMERLEKLEGFEKTELTSYCSESPLAKEFNKKKKALEKTMRLCHTDIHGGNVMKNAGGWKFVDLESFRRV